MRFIMCNNILCKNFAKCCHSVPHEEDLSCIICGKCVEPLKFDRTCVKCHKTFSDYNTNVCPKCGAFQEAPKETRFISEIKRKLSNEEEKKKK